MSDSPGPRPDFETSPAGQLLNRIVEAMIDMDLPDIGANVWLRSPPSLKGINVLPAIIVSELPGDHSPSDGTMTAPDVTFRAAAAVIYPGERVTTDTTGLRLYIEHRLIRFFAKNAQAIDRVLVDGCHLIASGITLGDPRVIEAWKQNIDATWIFPYNVVRYPSEA